MICEIDLLRKQEHQEDPAARRAPRWRRRSQRAGPGAAPRGL